MTPIGICLSSTEACNNETQLYTTWKDTLLWGKGGNWKTDGGWVSLISVEPANSPRNSSQYFTCFVGILLLMYCIIYFIFLLSHNSFYAANADPHWFDWKGQLYCQNAKYNHYTHKIWWSCWLAHTFTTPSVGSVSAFKHCLKVHLNPFSASSGTVSASKLKKMFRETE